MTQEAAVEPRAGPDRAHLPVLLACICAVSAVEGIDQVLLPCVAFALQRDLGLSLANFATLSLVQSLALSLCAPLWGVLADRRVMTRKWILILGAVLQGFITMILAGVTALAPMIVLRACNGAMLASLLPIVSGIIADVASEDERGRLFGWSQLCCMAGMSAGSLGATSLSVRQIAGMQGWRVVFLCSGATSLVVGAVVALFMTEPLREDGGAPNASKGCGAMGAEVKRLLGFFRMPTFCVLVVQGCVGGVGWYALHYQTLFFQVRGLGDFAASLLQVCTYVSQALGFLLGGELGDRFARRCPSHGRTLTAQISVFAGIPLVYMIFMVAPPAKSAIMWYLVLVVVLGLTSSWCCTGAIWPMLSQVVAPDCRSSVMAWETALERSVAAVVANVAVATLAQYAFGFNLHAAEGSIAVDTETVTALGRTLAFTTSLPWLICFLLYTLLHWSFPRDLRRVKQEQLDAQVPEHAARCDEFTSALL